MSKRESEREGERRLAKESSETLSKRAVGDNLAKMVAFIKVVIIKKMQTNMLPEFNFCSHLSHGSGVTTNINAICILVIIQEDEKGGYYMYNKVRSFIVFNFTRWRVLYGNDACGGKCSTIDMYYKIPLNDEVNKS